MNKTIILPILFMIAISCAFAFPTRTHGAEDMTPGTFGAGNYIFPDSIIVMDNLGVGGASTSFKLTITGGNIKLGGNLLDSTGAVIFDDTTKKIPAAKLPYEQGDITSDVATNTWAGGYYVVTNLIPTNVKSGIAFGRGQTGTLSSNLPTTRNVVCGVAFGDGLFGNSRQMCTTCYDCNTGTGACASQTLDGAAATAIGCSLGEEACRRCNAGTCGVYDDGLQHGCASGNVCLGGICMSDVNIWCRTHDGVYTIQGSTILCSRAKMWTTTFATKLSGGQAITSCNNLVYANFDDWILPIQDNLVDLAANGGVLADCNSIGPEATCSAWDAKCCCCGTGSSDVNYWSSTIPYLNGQVRVSMYNSYAEAGTNSFILNVRCMRG
jgi:hypothetical protein